MIMFKHTLYVMSLASSALMLAACGGDDNSRTNNDNGDPATPDATTYRYEINVANTTNNQPLSPIAVIAHNSDYSGWSIGTAASEGLAILAESGSPADLLAETTGESADQTSGSALLGSGDNLTLEIEVESIEELTLTVASMLVNTNDAFTGVTAWDVSDLAVGESKSALAPVYDAGTESNDESADTIPGPAAGGIGTSDGREDNDFVTRHPGVVTSADGYTESALDESHKFDNGAMLLTVTRIE